MRLNFKLSNLIGTSYLKGDIAFAGENILISPVGNRITAFDLKRDEASTISVASDFNILQLSISPCGDMLIVINEFGVAKVVSLLTGVALSSYKFRHHLNFSSFSPDGNFFAVGNGKTVQVFIAPRLQKQYSVFELYRTFVGANADVTCIDWSSDGNVFVVSSKDAVPRIYSVKALDKLKIFSLIGHRLPIVGAYFFENSLDIFSISCDGRLILFKSNMQLDDLNREDFSIPERVIYNFEKRIDYMNSADQIITTKITATNFNKRLGILVSGFEDGVIMVHMMPDFLIVSETHLFNNPISRVTLSNNGELVGFSSEELGQLAVLEWRSMSALLKIESHTNDISVLSYSPDGLHIATGGSDFRLKIWRVIGGRCTVTFTEHQAAITGLHFPAKKSKVVISSSLDGTVRAFDLHRYRNFRTMTVPSRQVQFACLAVDLNGDLVCAAGQDTFEAYLWSLQSGILLSVLTGHLAMISSIQFSPSFTDDGIEIASASWDGTVRLWDVGRCYSAISAGQGDTLPVADLKETFSCENDIITISYRNDGNEMAVCLLNGMILLFDTKKCKEIGSINAKADLGSAFLEPEDLITSKRISQTRKFLSLAYSADGNHLLAGGESKFVCLYSTIHQTLMKRFEITSNLSLAGVQEIHDRRSFLANLAKGSYSSQVYDVEDSRATLPLPGVRGGEKFSRRWYRPNVRVSCLQFSPTGDAFACASTEGVLIFSLDSSAAVYRPGVFNRSNTLFQRTIFDAISGGGLDIHVTPSEARMSLWSQNYSRALDIALRLRIPELLQEVIESIPIEEVDFISKAIPLHQVVHSMLDFLAIQLSVQSSYGNRHISFYAKWTESILKWHATNLRRGLASSALSSMDHKISLNSRKCIEQKKDETEEAFKIRKSREEALREKIKRPGYLIDRSEWASCQASLVRLESSLRIVKDRIIEPSEKVDHNLIYIEQSAGLIAAEMTYTNVQDNGEFNMEMNLDEFEVEPPEVVEKKKSKLEIKSEEENSENKFKQNRKNIKTNKKKFSDGKKRRNFKK